MGFWTVSPPLLYIQCGFRPNDEPGIFRSLETKDLTVNSLIETYLKVKAENERLLFTQKAVIQCGLRDVRAVSYVRENIIRSSRLDLECLESHWGRLGHLDLECLESHWGWLGCPDLECLESHWGLLGLLQSVFFNATRIMNTHLRTSAELKRKSPYQ